MRDRLLGEPVNHHSKEKKENNQRKVILTYQAQGFDP